MTKPISSPVSTAAQDTNVAARTLAAKAPAGFVELSGADLEALTHLQQTLHANKSSKWIQTEDEAFVTSQGTVIDSPEWVMAQAEPVVEVILGGAGGAAGGAGGAAGGAAAGAGAAGAAGAAAVLSPLTLLPAVALVPNNNSSTPPTPTPPPPPPPVPHAPLLQLDPNGTDPIVAFKLPVNAGSNDPVDMRSQTWHPTDPDANTTFHYFFELNDPNLGTIDVQGMHLSSVSADGQFQINELTGQISRTNNNDQIDPVPFCIDDHLKIVVTDGAVDNINTLVSNAIDITIDRTLPTFGMLDANTNHSISYMVNNSPTDEHGIYQIVIHEQNIDPSVRDIDKLDADISGSHVITELNFTHQDVTDTCSDGSPVGHNLVAEIDFQNTDLSITHTVSTVVDQFGADTSTSVEYVHFAEQATFKGYVLNLYDHTDPNNTENPDESGFYRLITNRDPVTGDLIATDCEDVLAGLDGHCGEILNGLGGNDLIFSHGDHNTLIGGAGYDLLSIGGNDNIVNLTLLPDNIPNGADTVVNFFNYEGSQIDLGITTGSDAINTLTYVDSDNLNAFLNSFVASGDTSYQIADKIDSFFQHNAVILELSTDAQQANLLTLLDFNTANMIAPSVFENIFTITYSPSTNIGDPATTATLCHYVTGGSPLVAEFVNSPIGDFSSCNFVSATNWVPPVLPV